MVLFATTEGGEVFTFVFMRAWVSVIASEVPTNADDPVVGAEEVMVVVFQPCCLPVTFELGW